MKELLDRLEYHGGTSHKFWHLRQNGHGGFIATWGRCGTSGNETHYNEHEALKKFREKIAKGYERVHANLQQAATERMNARRKEVTNSGVDFLSGLAKVK